MAFNLNFGIDLFATAFDPSAMLSAHNDAPRTPTYVFGADGGDVANNSDIVNIDLVADGFATPTGPPCRRKCHICDCVVDVDLDDPLTEVGFASVFVVSESHFGVCVRWER